MLGVPIAVTLFQGGAYTHEMAYATGDVLVVAAFAVLPLSISYLCTYAFYSLQGNRTVALINLPVVARPHRRLPGAVRGAVASRSPRRA